MSISSKQYLTPIQQIFVIRNIKNSQMKRKYFSWKDYRGEIYALAPTLDPGPKVPLATV